MSCTPSRDTNISNDMNGLNDSNGLGRARGVRRSRRIMAAVALVALATFGGSLSAQSKAQGSGKAPHFPWQDEELQYKIQVNGATAVMATVRSGKVRKLGEGAHYVPLSASARSVGVFSAIYPVDDRANTFINPSTLEPLRSEKVFREAGKERTYRVDFAPKAQKARVHKTLKNGEAAARKYTFITELPLTTDDALSWMYRVRALPEIKEGQTIELFLYDGWKLSRMDLKVVGKEDVHTPAGWFKGAWKIEVHRELLRTRTRRDQAKTAGAIKDARAGERPDDVDDVDDEATEAKTNANKKATDKPDGLRTNGKVYTAKGKAGAGKKAPAKVVKKKIDPRYVSGKTQLRVIKPRYSIGTIWLSADAKRLPIKAEVDLTASARKGKSALARYGKGELLLTSHKALK